MSRNSKDNNMNAYHLRSDTVGPTIAVSLLHEQPGKQIISFTVNSNKVGKIVGHRGSKIRRIQKQTNTEILIERKLCESESMKQIQITGLANDAKKAQQIIIQVVNEQTPGHSSKPHNKSVAKKNAITKSDLQRKQGNCSTESGQSRENLPEIFKNFYIEDPDVINMSPEKVQAIRIQNDNTTVGLCDNSILLRKIPNPIESFHQCFRNHPEIMERIDAEGFIKPSAIQAQAWPILLSGFDLVAIVDSVFGKTLSFLLPALIHIDGQITPRCDRGGPTLLVLTSNQEMAQNIKNKVAKFIYNGIEYTCLNDENNRSAVACWKAADVVITTPEEVNDLMASNDIDLKSVSYLVLHETDRLLNLGLERQIQDILQNIHPDRQTVITTATWSPEIRRFVLSSTINAIQLCVGSLRLAGLHSDSVEQTVHIINTTSLKNNLLRQFLRSINRQMKIIIFCNTELQFDYLNRTTLFDNYDHRILHSGFHQHIREQALRDFDDGTVQILITTELTREIEVSNITHVINYDFPYDIEKYIQRLSLIKCDNQNGNIISFFAYEDWDKAKDFISILEMANQTVPRMLYHLNDMFQMWHFNWRPKFISNFINEGVSTIQTKW